MHAVHMVGFVMQAERQYHTQHYMHEAVARAVVGQRATCRAMIAMDSCVMGCVPSGKAFNTFFK